MFTNQARQIAELALQRRLPSIYGVSEYTEAGGLMVYSTNLIDLERRAGREAVPHTTGQHWTEKHQWGRLAV